MAKNIIFCADGTWNGPEQDDNHDNVPDPTNVYKLFQLLEGSITLDLEREKEKELSSAGVTTQVAKYLHGVGDADNPLVKVMGGIFGAGIIARIVRGYTFISREYQSGDSIFIVGFSRGAYAARALAGFIARQGFLAKKLTADKDLAYEKGCQAWYRYRKGCAHPGILQRLAECAAHLPAFFTADTLEDGDCYQVASIKAVAVWDTVGAIGLPDIDRKKRIDDFGFANNVLDDKVLWGLHAVSVDERRVDFTPTLWQERDRVKQLLFPGAHSDVGGGYPGLGRQSELSDGAFRWMVDELKGLDVRFVNTPGYDLASYPTGVAHRPWGGTGRIFETAPRSFSEPCLGHCSIQVRADQAEVYPDPEASPEKYAPRIGRLPICSGGEERVCAYCVRE